MRSERLFLEDIIAAADSIKEFISNHTIDSFLANDLLKAAVAYHLIVIGEAGGQISSSLRDRYPEVPWPKIRGSRNLIVHEYFGIAWEEAWNTASISVPPLRAQIAEILRIEYGDRD